MIFCFSYNGIAFLFNNLQILTKKKKKQWLGEADLRTRMQGRLILVHLMCRDLSPITTETVPPSDNDTEGKHFAIKIHRTQQRETLRPNRFRLHLVEKESLSRAAIMLTLDKRKIITVTIQYK